MSEPSTTQAPFPDCFNTIVINGRAWHWSLGSHRESSILARDAVTGERRTADTDEVERLQREIGRGAWDAIKRCFVIEPRHVASWLCGARARQPRKA